MVSLLGLAGCLTRDAGLNASSNETPTRQTPPAGPVRCRGETTSAEKTITDEPGYDDEFEYFPENQTIRFVKYRPADSADAFGTWSFTEWGRIESADVGLERTRVITEERLGTDAFGSSMWRAPDGASVEGPVIWVAVATQQRDNGTEVTPEIPLAKLADVAPRSVEVTVTLSGDTFSRSVPVFAEHQTVGFA